MDQCRSLPFCRTDLSSCQFAPEAARLINWVIIDCGERAEHRLEMHTILFIRKGSAHINSARTGYTLSEGEFVILSQGGTAVFTTDSHASVLLCGIGEEFITNEFFKSEHLAVTPLTKKTGKEVLKMNIPIEGLLDSLEYHISKGLRCCGYIRVKYNELGYLLSLYYEPEQLLAFFHLILDKDIIFKCMVAEASKTEYSIDGIAKALYMTRRGFCKRFVKVFNEAPSSWLSRKKAKRIYKELVKSDRPLKDIMDEFNFPSASSFNYFCLKHFKITPGKLRKTPSKTLLKGKSSQN